MTRARECVPIELRHLPTISLEDLVFTADLQTRRERKYLLPREIVGSVLDGVTASVLEIGGLQSFRYESIYFDTRAWDSFLGAAHRRPRRFKVRTRTYLDSDECVLEVKVRNARGDTVKHRLPYNLGSRSVLTRDGVAFVRTVEASAPFADRLHPVLNVSYCRSTLVLEEAHARVTVDQHAAWCQDGSSIVRLDDLVLLETKTPGPPCEIDRALWRVGHRPITISKYCTGLAAFEDALPSNKWHRVLRREVMPHLSPAR